MEEFKAAWESAIYVQYVIGDGHRVRFWLDAWCGTQLCL